MSYKAETPCRIGAVFLLREDGAALLQLRDSKPGLRHAGMWVPPGGHANPGEDIIACARRELQEETGYWCDELWPVTELLDDTELPVQHLTFFGAMFDGQQKTRCMEGQALEFMTRERAATCKTPSYLGFVWDLALTAANNGKQI